MAKTKLLRVMTCLRFLFILLCCPSFAWATGLNANNTKNEPSGIIIFVSFSMPENSLKTWLTQASDVNVPVVIRGLKDNSLQSTAQAMYHLVKNTKKGGIQINPLWFERFAIQTVPAVVAVQSLPACPPQQNCRTTSFDVVYGDIPLKTALQFIVDKGEMGQEIAKTVLNHLEKNDAR